MSIPTMPPNFPPASWYSLPQPEPWPVAVTVAGSTLWLGPEIYMPFTNYLGANDFTTGQEVLVSPVNSAADFLVTRYDLAWYNFGTNNGSNYWSMELWRLDSGVGHQTLATIDTHLGSSGTWPHQSTTSFSNNPILKTDIWIEINLSTTGSPGSIRLAGVKVAGRKIYT